jgi:outer membrane receptor protein involved in Fe transport
LLVQLDGRTVYNPVFTGVFWDVVDFPLEDIERIEVIRGPGASVWGANAVIGVINIITKRAADTQGSLVVAGGGTEEQGFGTLRYGDKPRPDLAYRVYVKGFHREEQFAADGDPNGWWWGASGVTLAFPIAGEGGWVLTLLSADTSVRVAVLYTADGSTPRRGAQPVATAPGHDGRKGSGLAPLG